MRILSQRAVASMSTAPERSDTTTFRIGYEVFGPVFVCFVEEVLTRARAANIEYLHFLARDGDLLLRIAQIVSADRPGSPEFGYTYLSRLTLALPATPLLDREAIAQVLRIASGDSPPRELLYRFFGLPAEHFSSPDGVDAVEFLLSEQLQPLIAAERHRQTELLRAYLQQQGFFDSRRQALVDVGWRGTIQNGLAKVFPELAKLAGFYIGLWSDDPRRPVPDTDNYQGIISDSRRGSSLNEAAAWHAACLVEALARADHGTVLGYRREGDGRITPLLAGDSPSRIAETVSAEWRHPLLEGVLQFARDYAARRSGATPMDRLAQSRRALLRLAFFPSRAELAALAPLAVTEGHAPDWSSPLVVAQRPAPWRQPASWARGLRSPWRGGYVAATAGRSGSWLYACVEAGLARMPASFREKLRLAILGLLARSSQPSTCPDAEAASRHTGSPQ